MRFPIILMRSIHQREMPSPIAAVQILLAPYDDETLSLMPRPGIEDWIMSHVPTHPVTAKLPEEINDIGNLDWKTT